MSDEVLTEAGIEVVHHFGGGTYIKECRVPTGLTLGQHAHDFEHLSTLIKGTAVVSIDGVDHLLIAPHTLLIEARKTHSVQALSDIVWHCIWATNCVDPDLVNDAVTCGE